MDWVKDPKNQKIVVPIAIAIIIGVGVFYYFNFIKQPSVPAATAQTTTTPVVQPGTSVPGAAPAPQPAATTTPAAATPGAAAPGATAQAPVGLAKPGARNLQVAQVTPMETWRGDPFQPIGYKPPPNRKQTPPITDFPFEKLPGVGVIRQGVIQDVPEIQQPPRRMAGILLNDRVYAIIESNGTSQVVQPGDYLLDRLASVVRIEPGKVVLKTVDKKPRYITVRMAASAHTNVTGVTAPTVPSGPSFPPPPGMPRMRPSSLAPPGL